MDFFLNPKTVLESEQEHLEGVKEKEKIDLTTPSAFKKTFFGFFQLWV